MLKAQVHIGRLYQAKISGTMAVVQVLGDRSFGGWYAENLDTGRSVTLKTAQKLRAPVYVCVDCGQQKVDEYGFDPDKYVCRTCNAKREVASGKIETPLKIAATAEAVRQVL